MLIQAHKEIVGGYKLLTFSICRFSVVISGKLIKNTQHGRKSRIKGTISFVNRVLDIFREFTSLGMYGNYLFVLTELNSTLRVGIPLNLTCIFCCNYFSVEAERWQFWHMAAESKHIAD